MGVCGRKNGVAFLPVLVAILTVATFVITYAIAVVRTDVSMFFPYISDTGALPPESCVFSLLLTLCAISSFMVIVVRYMQVQEYNRDDVGRLLRLNRWSTAVGCLSCFGMLMVASFQDMAVPAAHFVGATLTFVGGLVYCALATAMSFRAEDSKLTRRCRLAITLILGAALATAVATGWVANTQEPSVADMHKANCTIRPWKHHPTTPWPGIWYPCMRGYAFHVVSAACEWTAGVCFLVFFLTYTHDFRKITWGSYVRLNSYSDFVQVNERATMSLFT